MKRVFNLGLVVGSLLAAGRVYGDVLYWMFEESDMAANVNVTTANNGEPYYFAQVVAVMGGEERVLALADDSSGYGAALVPGSSCYLDLTGYDASWSFMVEVWNYGILNKEPNAGVQWYLAGGSALETFEDLQKAGHVLPSPTRPPDLSSAWHPAVVIPEPSGGLLLLFGFALGALMRPRSRREV